MAEDKIYSFYKDFSGYQKREMGKLLNVFGRYTGLINTALNRKDYDKIGLHWFQTLSPNMTELLVQKKEISSGGLGIDEDPIIALKKSFGEGLERYALSVYDKSSFKIATLDEVSAENQISYDNLIERFSSPEEINDHYAYSKEKICWTYVSSINDSEIILYPAGQIYIPCDVTKRLSYVTSTGVSFNSHIEKTLESGLLEVIERDALILNHYFVKNFTAINNESIKLPLLTRAIDNGFAPIFIKLKSDTSVPVILCILRNKVEDSVLFGIGCSAALKEIDAVKKSLIEALFTYNYSQYLIDLRVDNADQIKALYEHFLYYQTENNFNKLLKNYRIIKTVDITSDVRISNIINNDFGNSIGKIFYKDITCPEIDDIGFNVTRVIVPNAYDLHVREAYFNPNTSRAERFKKYCRTEKIELKEAYSKIPHPMP